MLQYSILLLYRPFLILRATKRIAKADTGLLHNESLEASENDTIVDEACQYAIDAATESIRFFCRLFETNFIQKVRITCFIVITHNLTLLVSPK